MPVNYVWKFSNGIKLLQHSTESSHVISKINIFDNLPPSHNTECLSLYEDRILYNAEHAAELTQKVAWYINICKFVSGYEPAALSYGHERISASAREKKRGISSLSETFSLF